MAARTPLVWIILSLVVIGCTTPKSVVRTDEYHAPEQDKQVSKALNGLQIKALQLMNQQQFENSILYLQRAIKVEPRNPLNWHYMAQNYWFLKDYPSCRSMIQRAKAYSQFDEDLMRANDTLFQQCSP